jgi:hypothetical protein
MITYNDLNKIWRRRIPRNLALMKLGYGYWTFSYDLEEDRFRIGAKDRPLLYINRDGSYEIFFGGEMLNEFLYPLFNHLLYYFFMRELRRPISRRLHFLYFGKDRIFGNFKILKDGRITQKGRAKHWVDVPKRREKIKDFIYRLSLAAIIVDTDEKFSYGWGQRHIPALTDGGFVVTRNKIEIYKRWAKELSQTKISTPREKKLWGVWRLKNLPKS